MLQRYEWNNKEDFGYEGYINEDRYNLYTKQYNGYIVELGQSRTWYDDGTKSTLISILLCRYGEHNLLEECYCIAIADTIAEAWRLIRELELDSTQSAIQYLESLELFQELVRYEIGGFAELEGIDTKTGDLWLFIPIDNHHVEAWQKLYFGEGRYESSWQYVEKIEWYQMTPLERKKALGWAY